MAHAHVPEIVVEDMKIEFPPELDGEVVIHAIGQCECCGEPASVRVTLSMEGALELVQKTAEALRPDASAA